MYRLARNVYDGDVVIWRFNKNTNLTLKNNSFPEEWIWNT